MAPSNVVTPFPLGAYTGNPDISNAANEAGYEAGYSSFVSTLGAAPQFLDLYVDHTQPISQWVGNASFYAASDAQSAEANTQTPVIGLPMASTAPGSATPDAQFQAFASGQYDGVLQGIVKAYADEGFKTLVFRPGWEMNLQGPTYAGDSAQSQADWVKAFQHIYEVLHQSAAAEGVSVQVVWNPGVTNYSNAEATTNLYPGDAHVDAIGADVYSDIYPFTDSNGATPTYHDWDTGKEDTSVTQFLADPVNRLHYWNTPAANDYSSDASGGHSQSFASIVQFAEAHAKSLAIPETGAGNSGNQTDVIDDAAFPQWLAQQLNAARAAGEKIDFVNVWDSNGGGNYEFSTASDGKPQEAAAWAKYFGAEAAATSVSALAASASSTPAHQGQTITFVLATSETVAVSTASGLPTLTLSTGGIASYDAVHSTDSTLAFTTTVAADQSSADLRVTGLLLNGASITDSSGNNLSTAGVSSLSGTDTGITISSATPTVVLGSGPDTLTLNVVEDAYKGDAQFTVSIDGVQVGGAQTAVALRGIGTSQAFELLGSFGINQHTVSVNFLNDLWAGTPSTDRNLYVTSSTVDSQAIANGTLTEWSGGSQQFSFSVTPSAPVIIGFNAAATGSSANSSSTSVVIGTAQAATTVTVYDGGVAVGSTITTGSGSWSITSSALSPGTHSLTATATNQSGQVSMATAADVVTITAPTTLALSTDTGASASDEITSSASLAGGGGANAVVTIHSGTSVLGTTTADGHGHWSFTPTNLVDGSYTLAASEIDVAGNISSATLTFVLDTTAPVVAEALARDTGASSSDKITSSTVLSGSGDVNATITISNGASVLGTTTADSHGHWSFMPSSLADGSYTLTAKDVDAAGNIGSATLSLVLDTVAPATTIRLSNDTGSSNTDRITSSAWLTGGGDAGATVTIRKGTTVLGTTTADSAGHWSYSPSGLSNGSNTLTATETDTAGNSGTATIAITLDTIAPMPAMTIITGISGGGVTLAGTSEANSTVTVSDTSAGSNTVVGTVTTGANGAWSLTSRLVVDVSKIHTYTASSIDTAGNAGVVPGSFYLASTANDTLMSTANVADVFAIMSFKGTDVINGFEASSIVGANHDCIDFSGRGITSFSQVQSMMSGTTSTIINMGSGKIITVSNIAPSILTAADFRYS